MDGYLKFTQIDTKIKYKRVVSKWQHLCYPRKELHLNTYCVKCDLVLQLPKISTANLSAAFT